MTTAIEVIYPPTIGLLGVVIGYIGTLVTEERRDSRAAAARASDTARDREQRHAEERRTYQIEILKRAVAVLIALRSLAISRAGGEAVGAAGLNLIEEGIGLTSLIFDDDVRLAYGDAYNDLRPVAWDAKGPNPDSIPMRTAIELIGERLKTLYAGVGAQP